VRAAVAGRARDLDFERLEPGRFQSLPAVSIDDALFSRSDKVAVVPCAIGWSDIGSWEALHEVLPRDTAGNAVTGDVLVEDCAGCHLRSDGVVTAALGLRDLIVVAPPDAVLVAPRDRAQEVRTLVRRLDEAGRSEAKSPPRVFRPWGFYQPLHAGERFQVKRLTVLPGQRLSLQKHFHRAEHWVVVNGTALVTRDDERLIVRENESVYLPLGCAHRLENPGKVPLNIIEVQSGAYLGEDDIVRIEDSYGRG